MDDEGAPGPGAGVAGPADEVSLGEGTAPEDPQAARHANLEWVDQNNGPDAVRTTPHPPDVERRSPGTPAEVASPDRDDDSQLEVAR